MVNVSKFLTMLKDVEEAGQSIRVGSEALQGAKIADGTTPVLEEIHQLRRAKPGTAVEANSTLKSVATEGDRRVLPKVEFDSAKDRPRTNEEAVAAFRDNRVEEIHGLDLASYFAGLRIGEVLNFQKYGQEIEEMDRALGLVSPEERALHFPSLTVRHLDERTPPRFQTKAQTRLPTFTSRIEGDLHDLLKAKPNSPLEQRAADVGKILSRRTWEFFNEHMDAIDVEKSRRVTALRGALAEMKPDPDFHEKFYFTDSNYLIAEERQKFDLRNPDLPEEVRDQEHGRIGKEWYGQYRKLEDMSNEVRATRDAARIVDEMRHGLDNGLMPPQFDVRPYGLRPVLDLIHQDKAAFTAAHPELTPNQLRVHLEDVQFIRISQHKANKYGRLFGDLDQEPEREARRRMLALKYGLIKGELPPGFELSDFHPGDLKAVNDSDHATLWSDPKMMWKEGKPNWPALYQYVSDRRLEQWRGLIGNIRGGADVPAALDTVPANP
jgi:hypothetical protein